MFKIGSSKTYKIYQKLGKTKYLIHRENHKQKSIKNLIYSHHEQYESIQVFGNY